MASRGYEPRWLWQGGPLAQSAGSLFIRSFERGERVHQAMVARGFSGRIPVYGAEKATPGQWLAGLSVPGAMVTLAVLSLTVL
jgi:cobalt/nickel transport system permease protein